MERSVIFYIENDIRETLKGELEKVKQEIIAFRNSSSIAENEEVYVRVMVELLSDSFDLYERAKSFRIRLLVRWAGLL